MSKKTSENALPAIYLACSGTPDLTDDINYPVFVSTKFDGIRCICLNGVAYTRKMLPFKDIVQERFKEILKISHDSQLVLDGELYNHDMTFQQISSATSHYPEIERLKLHLFDCVSVEEWFGRVGHLPYFTRKTAYTQFCNRIDKNQEHIIPVVQHLCKCPVEVLDIHNKLLEEGYEGTMLRSPNGIYKHGRSTAREKDLRKFKPFDTLDAIIIGFQQKERLTDEAKEYITDKDAFGRSKRGHRKDDREAVEEIGALICEIPGETYIDDKGKEQRFVFKATFTKNSPVRTEITWENRADYLHRWVEVEYQTCGIKYLPRLPRVSRFRDDLND